MACTNGGKLEDLCEIKDYYVNPKGDLKPLTHKNTVSKSKKKYNIINQQVKDSNEKIDLANIELILWSSSLGISIIILLILLRNLNN